MITYKIINGGYQSGRGGRGLPISTAVGLPGRPLGPL